MNAVFLSDAHIRGHDDPNLPPLLDFLGRLRGKVERLYILGDLFDTWFAFPRAVFAEYVPVLGALYELKRSGTRIVYVLGNHDFELGEFFTNILEAEVHDTEFVLEMDGRRALVAHGDMVDASDRGYRRLRKVLRARPTRWLGRRLPPRWIWAIAQRMSERWTGDSATGRTPLQTVFAEYAAARRREGFDPVILAHLHVPVFETSPQGTYVNLGDWTRARTFLRWDAGRLTLCRWVWPAGQEERVAGGQ